ncbi:TniQ family protein [Scytonema sp. NUACC21]
MKIEPIRLCAACYAQSSYHNIEWQFKVTRGCARHKLSVLSECPNSGARKIPALWVDGWFERCFVKFAEMVKWQKVIQPNATSPSDANNI